MRLRKLIPKQISRRLRSEFRDDEKERRAKEDAALPRTPLADKHIRNLRVVLDRSVMLELMPKDAVVAEIGVDRGDFTQQILDRCAPRKLHLIDSWASERYHTGLKLAIEERFRERIEAGAIAINQGLSTDALAKFDDGYFDWVYIDTNHKYGTTRDELALAARKLKPGGLISGHDYAVGNWIGGLRYGVIEAVREFCVREGWEFVFLTVEEHDSQSFALRKIKGD